jgi:ribonuclease D
MIEYARMDTHYLIDIYNIMKDALIDKGNEQNNLLNATYSQSNALCKSFKNSYIIQ